MNYLIYYTDGSTDNHIETASTLGVAVIVEKTQTSRTIHNRCAYYVYTKDGMCCCNNLDGMLDLVLHKFDNIIRIFQGRTMVNDDFWRLYEKVKLENP